MHLVLVLIRVPSNVLLLLALSFLNLSQELLLFKSYALPLKLDSLELLPILLRELIVLGLSVFELLSLHLVLFVN